MDTKFKITDALRVAMSLKAELEPHCTHVCIAGSIRRGRPMVSDIELLFVPKMEERIQLFDGGDKTAATDIVITHWLNHQILRKRPNVLGRFMWGPQNKLALHVASKMPVDLFQTTADNWHTALVIRTGSSENNIRLAQAAIGNHRRLQVSGGIYDERAGAITWPRSEEEVFELCGLKYLPPERR